MPVTTFLNDYWQKKPLLVRDAFTDIKSPLSPDELAGLACEPDCNARIVHEQCNDRLWCVQNGPFDEKIFSILPEQNWSLLVSQVECYIDEAYDLQQHFRFIPDWRIDDIMISYAPPGGSVGPHVDSYDVFLLQLHGRRHWAINDTPEHSFLENTDLQVLANFRAQQSWILEPGDMLYLPPGVAHHGIAEDECMTCSIGFRAPSVRDLVSEFDEKSAQPVPEHLMYTDPDLQPQKYPAQISPQALNKISALINTYTNTDPDSIPAWFGEYISGSAFKSIQERPSTIASIEALEQKYSSSAQFCISACTRIYFIEMGSGALLFVDGCSYDTSISFAQRISSGESLSLNVLLENAPAARDKETLATLYNEGLLVCCDEDYL